MTSHGIEYPIGLALWVSPTSFLRKLTLPQLSPGRPPKPEQFKDGVQLRVVTS